MLLAEMVLRVQNVQGAIIECGVLNGDSAQAIVDANGGRKKVILVDGFEGLPNLTGEDRVGDFEAGQYKGNYEAVKKRFEYDNSVEVIKGNIPEALMLVKSEFYSLIHIDLDLYKPTIEALMILTPRLNKFGIVMVHDKSKKGVKKAILEWRLDREDYFMAEASL
jgi:O-methyltransferase